MSTAARPTDSHAERAGTRLRNFAIGSLFALVLLIPKLLRVRQNAQTWFAFRILLAVAGAMLVVAPLSLGNTWFAAIVGLAMFLAAILLPAAKSDNRVAEKAKELGTLVVVNGGKYRRANSAAIATQLFAGAERIVVVDSSMGSVLIIPVAEISSTIAAESGERWILRVRWLDDTADFEYQGVFGEHLARVAESTIRGLLRSPLPVLRQSRAASA